MDAARRPCSAPMSSRPSARRRGRSRVRTAPRRSKPTDVGSAVVAFADAIGERRGIARTWTACATNPATPCTPALTARLAEAVAATGTEVLELPGGAGHDAVTMAGVTDVAMLFVRCAGGISHHPDEAVELSDVALAIDAATRFVRTAGGGP